MGKQGTLQPSSPNAASTSLPCQLNSFVYRIVWTLYKNEYFTVCTVLFYRKGFRASTTQSPEQQLYLVAFNRSRILTASHFSSMVITDNVTPSGEELPCLYLPECFLDTSTLMLLTFFCTYFFFKEKKKKLSQNVFWLLCFVLSFIQLGKGNWIVSMK